MTALPDARVNKNVEGPGLRAKIQKFGGYLAGMIMPNIGAFIAWLLDRFLDDAIEVDVDCIADGSDAESGVMIGGITEFATLTGTPMFLGAMIMGPFAGWVLKQFDKAIEGKVRAGFEMVVDNFSLGIFGMLLAILGTLGVGPVVAGIVGVLSLGVNWLVAANLLPLASSPRWLRSTWRRPASRSCTWWSPTRAQASAC